MTWVAMPVKQDGDGYTELLEHPHGASHFGAWVAIVQIAARCDPRGTLVRDGGKPHDSVSMSRMSRIPSKILDAAIERLVSVGWLEVCGMSQEGAIISHQGATTSQEGATIQDSTRQNRTGQNKTKHRPETVGFPGVLDTDAFKAAWAEWTQYRTERKAKLTATTIKKQLAKLEKLGHDGAIAAIEQSIVNGWVGLFEVGGGKRTAQETPQERRARKAAGQYPEDELYANLPVRRAGEPPVEPGKGKP